MTGYKNRDGSEKGSDSMARRKKTIVIRLTEAEAEGLMNVGNRGIADLEDAMGGSSGTDAEEHGKDYEAGNDALGKLGQAMREAWPETFSEECSS